MFDNVFACIVSLIFPICMVVCGIIWIQRPPTNRFGVSGFKTQRARASNESWLFAHRHLGHVLIPLGAILAAVSIMAITGFYKRPYIALIAVVGIQMGAFLLASFETELAIRRNFDDDGHPIDRE